MGCRNSPIGPPKAKVCCFYSLSYTGLTGRNRNKIEGKAVSLNLQWRSVAGRSTVVPQEEGRPDGELITRCSGTWRAPVQGAPLFSRTAGMSGMAAEVILRYPHALTPAHRPDFRESNGPRLERPETT
jgi:hypothetical protein